MVQWDTQRSFCFASDEEWWHRCLCEDSAFPQTVSVSYAGVTSLNSLTPGYSLALCSFAYVRFHCMQLVLMPNCNFLAFSSYLHYIVSRHRVGWSMYHTQCWSQCSTQRFSPIFLLNWELYNINQKQGQSTISVLNTSRQSILWSLVTPLKTDNLKIIYQANIFGISSSLLHF